MQNICFFNSIKFWGGGEKLQLENALEFRKKNYEVVVIAHKNSPLWNKAQREKLRCFALKVGNLSFLNLAKIVRLTSFYKKNKIDTIVFTTSQDLKIGGLSAKIAGVKNIVYQRGLAVPIKASFINRYIFKSVLTHIISNSEETKRNILEKMGRYISANKVHTIYHGIPLKKKTTSNPVKLKEIEEKARGIVLGNAGRLTKQKGQELLILLARKLKEKDINFTLFIAGTGELEDELKSEIQKHNLQNNVFLLGFVKNMDAFMNSLDIFLLSSLWEGFGFVIVEAMLRSLPLVAFNKSSNPEIISNGNTGFLIEYPDIDDFAAKTYLLMKNANLRLKMGQKAYKIFQERFVIEDRITELEEYILSH